GNWPTCSRLMVKSLHEAGTVIESTLNCIASLPSMVVLQSSTTAASPAVTGASVAASTPASAPAGSAGAMSSNTGGWSVAGAVVPGVVPAGAVSTGAVAGGVVAGVVVSCAGGGASLPPQAASTSAHEALSMVSLRFIGGSSVVELGRHDS